jgi:hypothetical protein
MSEIEEQYWFPAKELGLGWGLPLVWQGWAVLSIYFLLLIISMFVLSRPNRAVAIAALTTIFLFICWLKGEPLFRRSSIPK